MKDILAALRRLDAPGPNCAVFDDGTPIVRAAADEIDRLRTELAHSDAVIDAGGEPSPQCSFSQYVEWSITARKRHAERHGLPFPTLSK